MTGTIGMSIEYMTGNEKFEQQVIEAASELGYQVRKLDGRQIPEGIEDCEILFGHFLPQSFIRAKKLIWYQSSMAGVEAFVNPALYRDSSVILTSSSGAFGTNIAEYMVAATLMLMLNMSDYVRNQEQKIWKQVPISRTIHGSHITIVGMGDIGTSFAQRVKAMGAASITGVRKHLKPMPDCYSRQYLMEDLDVATAGADVVALSLPGTDETRQVITMDRLKKMQPHTLLINVGRGGAIDHDALCTALNQGIIGGAALDVTNPEPLPQDHPLWTAKNCLITPHISGYNLPLGNQTIIQIFLENLKRYSRNEPLLNIVDRTVGY